MKRKICYTLAVLLAFGMAAHADLDVGEVININFTSGSGSPASTRPQPVNGTAYTAVPTPSPASYDGTNWNDAASIGPWYNIRTSTGRLSSVKIDMENGDDIRGWAYDHTGELGVMENYRYLHYDDTDNIMSNTITGLDPLSKVDLYFITDDNNDSNSIDNYVIIDGVAKIATGSINQSNWTENVNYVLFEDYVVPEDGVITWVQTNNQPAATGNAMLNGIQIVQKEGSSVDIVFTENCNGYNLNANVEWNPHFGSNGGNGRLRAQTNTLTDTVGLVQRPALNSNPTNNTYGAWYGGLWSRNTFSPTNGQQILVEFDWTVYTAGRMNITPSLDITMSTTQLVGDVNANLSPPFTSDSDETSAMGFRINQNVYPGPLDGVAGQSNGTFNVYFSGYGTNQTLLTPIIDLSLLGLNPEGGDDAGDLMRVIYTAEKTTNANIWIVGLVLSNQTTGAVAYNTTQFLTNSTVYNATDMNFALYSGGNNTTNGVEGFEFDNFKGWVTPPEGPKGYYKWWQDNWPAVDLSNLSGDSDGDGLKNLAEYAFGGDPTDVNDIGTQPVYVLGSGSATYARLDLTDANRTASYTVQECDDLVVANWLTLTESGAPTTNAAAVTVWGEVYDEITHSFLTTGNDKFIRTKID